MNRLYKSGPSPGHNRRRSRCRGSCPVLGVERPRIAAQAGGAVDETTGGVVPPIHVATTFVRDVDNQYRRGYSYGRADNATVRQVEGMMMRLEGGASSLLLSSGMAAATTAFLALERPAHVIAPRIMYWALRKWLQEDAAIHGIDVTLADATEPASIAAAVRPGETKLIWIETPGNPLWTITDIAGTARLAHAAGALLGVDSTVATPVLSRPLALGADVVMHSATKYLNGHSDVIAGALVFARNDAYSRRAARVRTTLGSILGPFEAAFLLRGLHIRVRHQSASAMNIARHLARHQRIEAVLYPGLETHPGHAVAASQMGGGFGGMLSVRLKGGEAAVIAAAGRVEVWKRATLARRHRKPH
jgi:cystathionine gamma-synthase